MNLRTNVETLWELIRIVSPQQKKGSNFEVNYSNSDKLTAADSYPNLNVEMFIMQKGDSKLLIK